MFKVAVKGLLFDDNNKLLVLHKVSKPDDVHDLPGGGLEYGETLKGALKREVKEEINLDVISSEQVFTETIFNSKKQQCIFICFKFKVDNFDIKLSEEHDRYEWIDPIVLKDEDYNKWIYNLVQKNDKIFD